MFRDPEAFYRVNCELGNNRLVTTRPVAAIHCVWVPHEHKILSSGNAEQAQSDGKWLAVNYGVKKPVFVLNRMGTFHFMSESLWYDP